ncbi:DUF2167 domain-containing protein [Pseudobacteroides cellulosolvens]|uniref:Membrane-anchored protein n=1 Tax=Pseudobacteroides cellulosolvens ATCC 35603 = DSM 2933 TaxID=398512 RepID=A0A0L6JJP2_9FIRM|nr:DUF2167 domain-containing protein [Pseudobacteroides cellulosolvens]KNY25979.1 Protein of unknown function DUF2167, membrane [Pseudobacteroides cellulosolvens ATCC 35603 = DSM 2933]
MKNKLLLGLLCTFMISLLITSNVFAEEDLGVNWIEGPTNVSVGDMAKLNLDKDFLYADKADTVKLMKYFDNAITGSEIGSVFSRDESQTWYILFEYKDVGHIKDDDKDDIDADDLLESYKEGTKAQNKINAKSGIPPLNVLGWREEPKYDEGLHSLVWSTLLESKGSKIINYEARILSRTGYVSAILVCSESDYDSVKPNMKKVVDAFSFVEGKRYSDYDPSKDKTSEWGLAALVAGGVVASKTGILAVILLIFKKGFILIIAGIVALFTKLFRRGKKQTNSTSYETSYENPHETQNFTSSSGQLGGTYGIQDNTNNFNNNNFNNNYNNDFNNDYNNNNSSDNNQSNNNSGSSINLSKINLDKDNKD